MRKDLYLKLIDRLKRLVENEDGSISFVSEERRKELEQNGRIAYAVKCFRLWNRQVEFIQQEISFPMPAVFVEFGKISWRQQSGGRQDTEVPIALHVISEAVADLDNDNGDIELSYLDLLDKINECLSGFTGENFGSFTRSASIPCHDHEEILDSTEVFKVMVTDDSATDKLIKWSAKPKISIEKG